MSVQYALVSSSAGPVVLRRMKEGADFEMSPYGGMFYDACEEEETAHATMARRLETAEQDIREHFDFHRKSLDNFLEMDGAIIANDRGIFAENCGRMCKGFLKYLRLVKQHQRRLGNRSFLEYPSCLPGHYFYVLNGSSIGTCHFNRQLNSFGAESGIMAMQEQTADFRKRTEKLPYISLPLGSQDGAGLLLPDFKRNLTWNKQLLERIGLKLPSLTSENE
jgi:hypothetical protein